MALGGFYEAVVDQIDGIVEAYQGEFGLIAEYQVETTPVSNITAYLRADMDWIQSNQAAIARGSSAISNLIDGLVDTYQTTIYKLTFLQ